MSVTFYKLLDSNLAEKSYIDGYTPSTADSALYHKISAAPNAVNFDVYFNLARWYKHISSFSNAEKTKFPPKILIGELANAVAGDCKSATAAPVADEDDDDVDLFGSEEEDDAEAERIKAERLKAYSEKKSKKPTVVAKSSIVLDVKPWDDETDMKEMENNVRTIELDGLVWGASKLVPVGYGIKKLQIMCVVEDDKVSVDDLVERIEAFEDFVQSVDIAAFNKV